jgi:hypothetical protein
MKMAVTIPIETIRHTEEKLRAKAQARVAEPAPEAANDDEGADFELPAEFDEVKMIPPPIFGVLRDIYDHIIAQCLYPQPAFACGSALMTSASMIGNEYRVTASKGLRLNIYVMLVGSTSAGKNDPMDAVKRIVGAGNYFEGIASAVALIDTVADHPGKPQILDEASVLMELMGHKGGAGHFVGLSETYLSLYSRSNGVFTARTYASDRSKKTGGASSKINAALTAGIGGGNTLRTIESPFLCTLWSSTPAALAESMKGLQAASGLMNRILYFVSDDNFPKRRAGGALPLPTPQPVVDWLNIIGNAPPPSHDIAIADDVQGYLDRDAIRDRVGEWAKTKMARTLAEDIVARLTEQTLKIAGICAVARDPHAPVLDMAAFQYAFRIAWWSAKRLFDFAVANVADTPDEQIRNRILAALRNKLKKDRADGAPDPGWLRRSDLLKASKVGTMKFRDVFDAAITSNDIRKMDIPTTTTGGRPGSAYRINARGLPST